MRARGSGFLVAARQAAVRRPDAAEVVVRRLFVRFAPRLRERFVGAREERGEKAAAEARLRAGRGSFAMLFGVHMFESSFGGYR